MILNNQRRGYKYDAFVTIYRFMFHYQVCSTKTNVSRGVEIQIKGKSDLIKAFVFLQSPFPSEVCDGKNKKSIRRNTFKCFPQTLKHCTIAEIQSVIL